MIINRLITQTNQIYEKPEIWYELIDGQQRFFTSILFMCVIRDLFKEYTPNIDVPEIIDFFNVVKSYKLKINDKVENIRWCELFDSHIDGNKPKPNKIFENYNELKEYVYIKQSVNEYCCKKGIKENNLKNIFEVFMNNFIISCVNLNYDLGLKNQIRLFHDINVQTPTINLETIIFNTIMLKDDLKNNSRLENIKTFEYLKSNFQGQKFYLDATGGFVTTDMIEFFWEFINFYNHNIYGIEKQELYIKEHGPIYNGLDNVPILSDDPMFSKNLDISLNNYLMLLNNNIDTENLNHSEFILFAQKLITLFKCFGNVLNWDAIFTNNDFQKDQISEDEIKSLENTPAWIIYIQKCNHFVKIITHRLFLDEFDDERRGYFATYQIDRNRKFLSYNANSDLESSISYLSIDFKVVIFAILHFIQDWENTISQRYQWFEKNVFIALRELVKFNCKTFIMRAFELDGKKFPTIFNEFLFKNIKTKKYKNLESFATNYIKDFEAFINKYYNNILMPKWQYDKDSNSNDLVKDIMRTSQNIVCFNIKDIESGAKNGEFAWQLFFKIDLFQNLEELINFKNDEDDDWFKNWFNSDLSKK